MFIECPQHSEDAAYAVHFRVTLNVPHEVSDKVNERLTN